MTLTMQQMPSLGLFNKILCDSLGLWSSDIKDIQFNVPATEKERRVALNEAFSSIKGDDGLYGSLNELISCTTKIYPKDKDITRKNKTIQDYTNHLSKDDFLSYDELTEFQRHIHFIISDKYQNNDTAEFIFDFYKASINHYRQFIREFSVKDSAATCSFEFFIKNILSEILVNLTSEKTGIDIRSLNKNSEWPLKSFIDYIADTCNVSLYRLHQFHEIKRINPFLQDIECWNSDLKADQNTRSKQFIQRLSKNNKIKWEQYKRQINPFLCLLPESMNNDNFFIIAFHSFFLHNLNIYISGTQENPHGNHLQSSSNFDAKEILFLSRETHGDKLDKMINNIYCSEKTIIDQTVENYENFVKCLHNLNESYKNQNFPSTLDFTYNEIYFDFNIDQLLDSLTDCPEWISLWKIARSRNIDRDSVDALNYYKNALKKAKYVAGSLFMPFYIDVCSFCKVQYAIMRKNNEAELFDRFYESLGGQIAKYASLMGYFPASVRDPKTLLPSFELPIKSRILLKRIDTVVSTYAL